jgi:hypothetical protein
MAFTPILWKSQTQVNAADSGVQNDGQIAATHDGGYVVVWHSINFIIGQRYDSAGNKLNSEVIAGFNFGEQTTPAVTVLANGNIAVAFVDVPAADVYVQIFAPTWGSPLRLDAIGGGTDQSLPSITPFADGSYVVAYTAATSSAETSVLAKIVSAAGDVGSEFALNSETDSQTSPELATLSNGNFVAVFEDEFFGSATDHDIKYGIFTKTGFPIASAAVPGANSNQLETDPDVAALRDGGFVVVWTSPVSSVHDIRASILSNTGGTVASNILVNTTTAATQDEASVVALADGGFLVTWEDDFINLVRAQRFDAVGSKIGAEFTVKNGVSDGFSGDSPEAALLSDGRIAYAIGDVVVADHDVVTSIWTTPPNLNPIPPIGTTADLILRQSSTGLYEIYDIGNNTILAGYEFAQVGLDWQFAGLGGFFGSDTTDMLLRNSGTGGFEVYDISNNNITGAAFLGTVGLNWQVAGFGDFNHDSMTDMVLRNSSTGAFQVYNIVNNSITTSASLGTVGLNWQVGGFGNFSSLGETDMILRNTSTGGLEVYDINNNQITGAAFMGTVGLDWQIIAVGNFSSMPGESDVIMRNVNTGGLEVYDIANNQITGASFLGTVGLEWQFAGVAPVHAAGASDLVLRNVNTGAFEVYDVANNQITGAAPLGAVGLDFQVGGFAVDPPTGSSASMGDSSDVTQLVQAMAGFGDGESGDGVDTISLGADTSQQTLLTTPTQV